MPVLFLLFVVMPIIELALLIKVGGLIGLMNTVFIVLLTAFVGSYLLRREGLATLTRFNQRLQHGELPAAEIAAGFALAAGGALLLTPGFITDIIGFLLVLPGSRTYFGRWLMQKLAGRVHVAGFQSSSTSQFDHRHNQTKASHTVIEGEFHQEK